MHQWIERAKIVEERCIAESQRVDKHYYISARRGYDPCIDPTWSKADLQGFAARSSRMTMKRLFALVDFNAGFSRWSNQ